MKSHSVLLLGIIAVLIGTMGCRLLPIPPAATPVPPAATPIPPIATPVPPAATTVPPTPIPFVGGACDDRATPIEPNTPYSEHMHSTTQSYPANCLYYCLWIPDGLGSLMIRISDFSVDLDLYVGYGEFDTIFGSEIVHGETYTWKSNEFGTGDEEVNISNPEGGVYYIEVCSYEGEASSFQLETELH